MKKWLEWFDRIIWWNREYLNHHKRTLSKKNFSKLAEKELKTLREIKKYFEEKIK